MLFLFALLIACLLMACDRNPSNPAPAGPRPRVISLVPAATDLIAGMGLGEHLVAISNYDRQPDQQRTLPRVGDYQFFDWEQIASLRPDLMIVFMSPDRMPEGLKQRAGQLNIRLLNVRTELLEDVFATMATLGQALNQEEKAAVAAGKLRTRLDAVRQRTQGRPRPRVLLVREKNADGVVGRDNFLNDILQIAGGENVITASGWPSIDREMLLALKPDVILQLLPDASPQVLTEAQSLWRSLPQVPAVANQRVHILTDWYAQQPGSHLADLAEKFAALLHPPEATQ